jgi:hypothetical protein
MTTPAKVTPSRSGLHREATRAPASSAKSQCGVPPTASIPKTRDQPEEANSKRSQPSGNNASTGTSRVPATRQQMQRPTSDRQSKPHLDAAPTTGSAPTRPRTASEPAVRAQPIAHLNPGRSANHHQGIDPAGPGRVQRERWATAWATTVASSPTPNRSDDPRVRRKWTPQKYSPGTTVLAPSSVIGKPMESNAGNRTQPA